MFTALLIIAKKKKKRKQPKCPSTHKWVNKMWWYIHTTEYLAMKRNKVPIHAKIQVNLENILSERSQSQKATDCIIPITQKVQSRQITETDNIVVTVARG